MLRRTPRPWGARGDRIVGPGRLCQSAAALLWVLCSVAAAQSAPPAPANAGHPELWPAGVPGAANPDIDAFVARLMADMTPEEKVAQMIQADIASISPADLRAYPLGSILAGGNAAPGDNVRTSPHAWLALSNEFHRAALSRTGVAHAPIPILFGIDAVHGHAKIIGATIYPHNVGLGATHDPELIRRIGEATAQEVAATGIDWTFAPTVAVARDVRWGRSYESYSESPELVAQYAAAMVTGLQGLRGTAQFMSPGHTLSSVKHFLGDGGTLGGRDQGETNIPEVLLSTVHGAGYPAAINAGALIVMASYNSWNGVKMHANRYLLTDILKSRLAFDGFVVGDWNAQEQIPGCTKSDCAAAILAGVDMLMAPDSWRALYDNTLAEVRSGAIPQARVDDAVRRILRVKKMAGLFGRNGAAPPAGAMPPNGADDLARLGSAAHRALAREAVRKSLVLLKNEHATLPLSAGANVLVAGEAADSISMQTGGWTIDWQGDHNRNADFPGATSIFAGIKAALAAGGGTATLSVQGSFKRKPDAAIVVFGEGPYAEFEGDRENLDYSAVSARDLALLRRLHAAGVPTIAVFLSGRPMWVNPEINASDAFVAAWLPGSEGAGVADVLIRSPAGAPQSDFVGRLPFSWPETGMPVTFDAAGRASGALFARGWGLDYHSDVKSSPLAEDPRIPPQWDSRPGSLLRADHVKAPWSIFVADDSAEVHLTTARQQSPHGTVTIEAAPTGFRATWSGSGRGMVRITGRAIDLRTQASRGAVLEMKYRVEQSPDQGVSIGMRCSEPACGTRAGAQLDVTASFRNSQPGTWATLSLPLSCLTAAGADLAQVEAPFNIVTSGHFGVTISEVRLERKMSGTAPACP
jgi:beta-glucosidase